MFKKTIIFILISSLIFTLFAASVSISAVTEKDAISRKQCSEIAKDYIKDFYCSVYTEKKIADDKYSLSNDLKSYMEHKAACNTAIKVLGIIHHDFTVKQEILEEKVIGSNYYCFIKNDVSFYYDDPADASGFGEGAYVRISVRNGVYKIEDIYCENHFDESTRGIISFEEFIENPEISVNKENVQRKASELAGKSKISISKLKEKLNNDSVYSGNKQ